MNWIKSLFIRFKNWLASDLVLELQERNAKLLDANGILFGKCNIKDKEITRLNSINKFKINASISTKVRVWIKAEPINPKREAEARQMIFLLVSAIKEVEEVRKTHYKGKTVTKPLEAKPDHKGLSKGFRRK